VFLSARATAVGVRQRTFMDLARAQGVGPFALRYRHLAPNVLAVVLSRLGAVAARLVSGAVYAETVFAYPGINLVLTDAIVKHDYPLVRGALLATGLLLFAMNLLADALAGRLALRAQRAP
jgi:peptide/nickel transport system permease protein